MSKARDRLREVRLPGARSHGIANDYDVMYIADAAGLPPVCVAYHAAVTGRGGEGAKVQVHHLHHDTDVGNPKAHWRDYRRKTFTLFRYPGRAPEQRKAAVADAQAWASERYGVGEWDTVPGLTGAWFPRDVAALVRAALREVAKAER